MDLVHLGNDDSSGTVVNSQGGFKNDHFEKEFRMLSSYKVIPNRLMSPGIHKMLFVWDLHYQDWFHPQWTLRLKDREMTLGRQARTWLVQSISIFRIIAILIFSSLVFSPMPRGPLVCLYA